MQKPERRDTFANETEEMENMLDWLCWIHAEQVSLDLDLPQEDCADSIKWLYLHGLIRFNATDACVIPGPALAASASNEPISKRIATLFRQ
jgi:hypothetical protein